MATDDANVGERKTKKITRGDFFYIYQRKFGKGEEEKKHKRIC